MHSARIRLLAFLQLSNNQNRLTSKRVNLLFHRRNNKVIMKRNSLSTSTSGSYKDAVYALNSLQTNSAVIERIRLQREIFPETNMMETQKHLNTIGVDSDAVDSLNIIHVSGTKGKGSTCAFTEAILRNNGYKTGFYSSPHLLHVRERIRIDGKPLSEEKFAQYFWRVYRILADHNESEMPAYFKFLTVMAFYVFLQEKVDVALIEVGIGGAYDCTNIIKNPVVCGVTMLDYDHMSILGNSLEEIAWNKAGIFKPGTVGITVPQPPNALAVLCRQADKLETSLFLAPPISEYCADAPIFSGIPGPHQHYNIAMAVQLAKTWMARRSKQSHCDAASWEESVKVYDKMSGITYDLPVLAGFKISREFAEGIESCKWPGRSQLVKRENISYYLDGAHTPKSVEFCAEWFMKETGDVDPDSSTRPFKILVFHCTADRTPESLLPPLSNCDFDCALFCPPLAHDHMDPKSDQTNFTSERSKQMQKCMDSRATLLRLWSQRDPSELAQKRLKWSSSPSSLLPVLNIKARPNTVSEQTHMVANCVAAKSCTKISAAPRSIERNAAASTVNYGSNTVVRSDVRDCDQAANTIETAVFSCISDAVRSIEKRAENREVRVLVTGSLHLVGGVLGVIDPNLEM